MMTWYTMAVPDILREGNEPHVYQTNAMNAEPKIEPLSTRRNYYLKR